MRFQVSLCFHLLLAFPLISTAAASFAQSLVPPPQDNPTEMRDCPDKEALVGYNAATGVMLCSPFNGERLIPTVVLGNATVIHLDGPGQSLFSQWPPKELRLPDTLLDNRFAALHPFEGTMHWCGPDAVIIGFDGANTFKCSTRSVRVSSRVITEKKPPTTQEEIQNQLSDNPDPLPTQQRTVTTKVESAKFHGRVFVTPPVGRAVTTNTGQTISMPSCPEGSFLVGMHLGKNTFLCTLPTSCGAPSGCANNGICRGDDNGRIDIVGTRRCVDRGRGTILFYARDNCRGRARETRDLRLQDSDWKIGPRHNDDYESMRLNNVPEGTFIKVTDRSDGSTSDDVAVIRVTSEINGTHCLGGFEFFSGRYEDRFLKATWNLGDNLEGKVSGIFVGTNILSRNQKLCLDVPPGETGFVQLFECHFGDNQVWNWHYNRSEDRDLPVAPRRGMIIHTSGKCLSVKAPDPQETARRAPVILSNCTGAPNQLWTRTSAGELQVFSDLCLDIPNARDEPRARLQVFECNGGMHQRWVANL